MCLGNDGKSSCATLPTQQKSTLLPRVPAHTYTGCIISGQQPTRLDEFPQIHDVGRSKKKDAQMASVVLCAAIKLVWNCFGISAATLDALMIHDHRSHSEIQLSTLSNLTPDHRGSDAASSAGSGSCVKVLHQEILQFVTGAIFCLSSSTVKVPFPGGSYKAREAFLLRAGVLASSTRIQVL